MDLKSTNRRLQHFSDKLAFETDSWDLHEALASDENITVVDTRSREAYQQEHIPGAINIPHREMSPESTGDIDKDSLVITYCDGIGCNASTKGAIEMSDLGFEVKELMGGIRWWKSDGYETHGTDGEHQSAGCGC